MDNYATRPDEHTVQFVRILPGPIERIWAYLWDGKKRGEWFAGEYGPFCSKRCRLIDLGKWFNEEHTISEPLKPGHFAEFAELPDNADPDQPHEKQ